MKQTFWKRSTAMLLALVLILAAVPARAMAAENQFTLIELKGTDVTLDETVFSYTGEEIRPNVTVRVNDTLLTLDKDYLLEYKNNIEVGEAAVVVTGIATSGYMGTVEHPFYIDPKTSEEDEQDLITIIGTDVTIDGTEFPATGTAIEPAVTVTVKGQQLTAGEDYTLVYENNVNPGTASVTVTGVAEKGYTGSVTIHFTITAAPEAPTEPEETKPEETQPEETQPEETQPEETQPEETKPEETQPEETKPVSYKITKGDGATWHRNSKKELAFTADGPFKNFDKLLVDGKVVNTKYYTVMEGSTVIALKETFLQHLELGKHTLTIQFTDGKAEGTFKTSAPADESNPKTGDDFALHTWTAILFVSLTGTIGTVFAFRKKIWK